MTLTTAFGIGVIVGAAVSFMALIGRAAIMIGSATRKTYEASRYLAGATDAMEKAADDVAAANAILRQVKEVVRKHKAEKKPGK